MYAPLAETFGPLVASGVIVAAALFAAYLFLGALFEGIGCILGTMGESELGLIAYVALWIVVPPVWFAVHLIVGAANWRGRIKLRTS